MKGKLPHIGLVGDTYTITVDGDDTNGRFCVVDMHIPACGGPAPQRDDFEETFIVLDGEIEATFRGKNFVVSAKQSTFLPMLRINSTTRLQTPPVSSASVPPLGRRSSSWKSASPWRLAHSCAQTR
jgi:hypothetical protein